MMWHTPKMMRYFSNPFSRFNLEISIIINNNDVDYKIQYIWMILLNLAVNFRDKAVLQDLSSSISYLEMAIEIIRYHRPSDIILVFARGSSRKRTQISYNGTLKKIFLKTNFSARVASPEFIRETNVERTRFEITVTKSRYTENSWNQELKKHRRGNLDVSRVSHT